MVHEIHFPAALKLQRQEPPLNALGAQRQVELPVHGTDLWKFLPHAAVKRRHGADLMSRPRQRFAEGADHVRQSTGLGEWMDFGAGEKHLHRSSSKASVLKLLLERGAWNAAQTPAGHIVICFVFR